MTSTQPVAEPSLDKSGFVEEAMPWLDAVYRFALRLTAGNVAEAEDLAQDTFVRAYRSWHTFERGTSARSWLFTIARNAFLRTREQLARRMELNESEIDADITSVNAGNVFYEIGVPDPERDFFDSFIDDEVTRAIEQLPPDFREVVVLSDVEGLNYAEIAAVIDAPIGTVKSRLFRGRRQLERALYEYAVDSGYIRRPSA
jgi:RNA polymerase sigma-70 factor (ECF subfamily)